MRNMCGTAFHVRHVGGHRIRAVVGLDALRVGGAMAATGLDAVEVASPLTHSRHVSDLFHVPTCWLYVPGVTVEAFESAFFCFASCPTHRVANRSILTSHIAKTGESEPFLKRSRKSLRKFAHSK